MNNIVAKEKNPHAVALGRLGGLKGGKRRAELLSPEHRSAIAHIAACARWGREPYTGGNCTCGHNEDDHKKKQPRYCLLDNCDCQEFYWEDI